MNEISDEYMREMISRTKEYCIVLLRSGPETNPADQKGILWEHVRRNFSLRDEGILPVVCPVNDGSDIRGVGIFNTDAARARAIMDEDPGVKAGMFRYEVHPCRSFPGDCLP